MKFINIPKPLIIVGLLFICINLKAEEKVIDKIIASVGNNIILKSELETKYAQYLLENKTENESIKCSLLDELLYQKLLLAQAQKDSIEITEAQVEAELDRRMRYFISQFGSEEKFTNFYGKSIEAFKNDLRDNIKDLLLSERMQSKVVEGISISPSEVKTYFENLPKDSIPFINAEVEIGQIVKKPILSKQAKEEAKKTIEALRERVLKGEDMGTLAVLYSEDPGSAKDAGVYKNIPRGQFVPEFDAYSFRLKPKEISEVFETSYGYHFMQLLERRGDIVDIRHILITAKSNMEDLQKAKLLLDSIHTILTKDSISFSDAAGKFSDDEETKNSGGLYINPKNGISKFEVDELGQIDPTLVFTIDQMKVGEYTTPSLFTTRDGVQAYRILYLKNRIDPHKANLKEDYQRIQTAATIEKQKNTISSWIIKKQKSIYVKITDEYKNCTFEHNWKNN